MIPAHKDGYILPAFFAIGLHLSLAAIAIIMPSFNTDTITIVKEQPTLKAKIVDIDDTIIGQRIRAEQQRQANAKRIAQEEAQQKEQRRIEQARQIALKAEQKRQAEAARKLAERQKIAEENARLAAEKARQKAEAAKLAQQRRQDELAEKRKAEIAMRIAEEQAIQELIEEQASQEILAEELTKQLQNEQNQQTIQSLASLINARIRAAWIRPPNAKNGMKTTLKLHFLPNGEVVDVFVVESSGDIIFDNKAIDAVYKVGRIEELAALDSYLFERNFRQIDIIFNPQDLRN